MCLVRKIVVLDQRSPAETGKQLEGRRIRIVASSAESTAYCDLVSAAHVSIVMW